MNTVHTKWCHFNSFSSDYNVFVTAFQNIGLLNTHLHVHIVLIIPEKAFQFVITFEFNQMETDNTSLKQFLLQRLRFANTKQKNNGTFI